MIQYIDNISVPAGFPSPALDYMEQRVSLDNMYIEDPLATFLFNVEGDSMINAFIPNKSRVIIDRSLTPKNGDIVLAEYNGEFTVKFFFKTDFKCKLVAANPKYPDIELSGEEELRVFGVVTSIITRVRDVKQEMMMKK